MRRVREQGQTPASARRAWTAMRCAARPWGPTGLPPPTDRYRRLSAPGSSPLAGGWRLESDERDGIMCMTDNQYRYLVIDRNRPETADPAGDLSDAEAARLFYSFDAQGGSYVVAGASAISPSSKRCLV